MNKRQMIVLWAGIAAIVLICLFPPTTLQSVYAGGRWPSTNKRTDTGRLVGYLVAVSVVTGGLIYTLRDKEGKTRKPESKQNKSEDILRC